MCNCNIHSFQCITGSLCFNRSCFENQYRPYQLNSAIHNTSFELHGKTIMHINDIRIKRNKFDLFQLCNHSALYGTLRASTDKAVNITETLKGFLNFGKEIGNTVTWTRLWCCLEGKFVKCFQSPHADDSNKPCEVLELDRCTSGAVRTERPQTLKLRFVKKCTKGNLMVSRKFLWTDSTRQLEKWERSINNIVTTLSVWKCLKF